MRQLKIKNNLNIYIFLGNIISISPEKVKRFPFRHLAARREASGSI